MSASEKRTGRAGGRAARVAARAAGLADDEKAVRPGLSGGAYKPLTDSECRTVYDTALTLLDEFGMGSPIPEFIEVVVPAGGWVDEDGRLHFPRSLVEDAVDMAAKSFTWHGFDDDRSIEVGGDRVHFGTGGAAVSVYEHETRKHRPSDLQDVYDVARLVDTLEHVHFHVRTLVARDMVEARNLDVNTAYAVAMGTTKPMGTSFFQPEHVHEVVDMFDEMLGGQSGSFAKRPFCVANNTFVVPPLRYAEDAVRSMVPGTHRYAHQSAVGRPGWRYLARCPGRLAGPGPRRVSVRPDLRQPDEPRSSVRDGLVALRVRPPYRRYERGFGRGGGAERGGRPGH